MKLAFPLLFLGILFQTQAQIRLGATAGYNLYQSVSRETGLNSSFLDQQQPTDDVYDKSDYKPTLSSGFHAGMLIDLSIKKPVYLQIGLLYELISGTSKHYYNAYFYYPVKTLYGSKEYSERVHLTYFTMPVLLNFVKTAKKGKLSISVGPQFSWGLGGWYNADLREYSTTYYSSTVETREKKGAYNVQSNNEGAALEPYPNDPSRYYRQLYVALHLGLAYELNRTQFRVYYAQGITNTEAKQQNTLYNYTTNYSGINFSLTYFFVRYAIAKVPR